MRTVIVHGLGVAAVMALLSSPASAFGYHLGSEACYEFVSAKGAVSSSYRTAMSNAAAAWESRIARSHGRVYANWYYSADRTISCTWNTSGSQITCVARAGPCGPKKTKAKWR
jgi:hypothetical protein